MGRRVRKNTIKRIRAHIVEGRGKGAGPSYKPAIYTYEIPSRGKVARMKGETTGRVHHCLSQLEKNYLIMLDYDPLVSDICEQYSLDLEDTLLISAMTGIEHPHADQTPTVMTTDFLYCKNGNWHASAIKTTEDLNNERTKEKLEIERIYWECFETPWETITEEDIPQPLVTNLVWLHSGESLEKLIPDESNRKNIISSFLELYQNHSVPFSDIVNVTESYCHLVPGTMMQVFKSQIREGAIQLDLSKPIDFYEPRNIAQLGYTKAMPLPGKEG